MLGPHTTLRSAFTLCLLGAVQLLLCSTANGNPHTAADALDRALSQFLDDTGQVSPKGSHDLQILLQTDSQLIFRILQELDAEDPELTAPLLTILADVADGDTRLWPLQRFLDSHDERVKIATLQFLRTQPFRVTPEQVLILLSDTSPEVRRCALRVLGAQGDVASATQIRRALKDSHRLVRYAAVNALGDLNDAESVELLLDLARYSNDGFMQRCAQLALCRIDSGESFRFMQELLHDGDTRARAAALAGLTRCDRNPARCLRRLRRALSDAAPWVQERAMELLFLEHPRQCRQLVLDLLQESAPGIAQSLDRCLARVGTPDLVLLVRLMTPPFESQHREVALLTLIEEFRGGIPTKPDGSQG